MRTTPNLTALVSEEPRFRRKRHMALLGFVGATLIAALSQPGCQRTDDTAIQAIQSRISEYAKSVDAADPTLAAKVWEDSPDVSFIHPRGHEHGFEQIKHNVYEKLMGQTFSERKLSIHDVSLHIVSKDAAWAEFYWDFAAKLRKDGSSLATKGRETQVYRKGADGWRLVHVHYSGMPVTGQRQGF